MGRLVDSYKYDHILQIDRGLQYRNSYYVQIDGCIDKLMVIYIDRWLNIQIDGYIDRQMVKYLDSQIHG